VTADEFNAACEAIRAEISDRMEQVGERGVAAISEAESPEAAAALQNHYKDLLATIEVEAHRRVEALVREYRST